MKLWLWRDHSRWYEHLQRAAIARGIDVAVFSDPREPDSGTVFGRIHHDPAVRDRDKAAWAYMAANPALDLVPSYRASVLYDDKAEQARQLCRWMPRTIIAYSMGEAERAIDVLGLPLMSKCAAGAGSHNVRFIRNRDQAMREASAALGAGLPVHQGQTQRGYVLWQRFLPGNDYDFRVIRIGGDRLILRRGNRKDRPMASGSGAEMPITWPDAEASEVLDFADSFFAAEQMPFCGIDVVRDHDGGQWRLLECTTAWPLGKMDQHRFVSGRSGAEFWALVIDQIEAGALSAHRGTWEHPGRLAFREERLR